MYCSAMKFCGAMELCGLGFPRGEPMDHDWPACEAQIKAQNAAQVLAYSRDHKPEEAEFLRSKGFQEVSELRNPRTGTMARLWVLTMPDGVRPAPDPIPEAAPPYQVDGIYAAPAPAPPPLAWNPPDFDVPVARSSGQCNCPTCTQFRADLTQRSNDNDALPPL